MIRKVLFFFFLIGVSISANAQLSDLHYLPPLKQGQNNQGIREQAVYISTPEPTTFRVNVYRGTSNSIFAFFDISNVAPAVMNMSNGDNNIILVNNANTGIVLNNSGLRFEAPSGNRFYVNYRGNSSHQAASLTAKGRQAMGTRFKWGGVPNFGIHSSKSNTLGIMATEDNTTINLFGYDPGCEFRVGNNRAGITSNTHQITLNANESFVYETYIGTSATQAHEDGWIGASIVSDKNIVISNGSMNFGRQKNATNTVTNRDAGIDQPVPENRLGKEYVFVRGNGNANGWTEFPLIIAIADNTQIFINGSATPIATINNGDYFQVPSNLYSTNTAGANMLVQTSKDVYAYQCLAGANGVQTAGLNFVAPVNCLLPDVMDNIPDITDIAGIDITGGMTIIAAVNTPDANIIVTDGNGSVTLPASNAVVGSTDWKTFFIPNLNGNVSVNSTGPMAVGFFGFNGNKGVAGYFSGFDTVPEVSLEIRGGTGCFVGSEIYEATNSNFDAFQWYRDGVAIPGANSPSYAPPGAGEYFLRGTKGPCTYDSNPILGLYCDPDIHIEKTVDKAEISEGETATFTIRVQNWGVGPLTNLQVTDNIPTGLSIVSNFTLTGSFSGNTWNIGTLDGGEVAELELEVQADEIDTLPLLSLTNTVTHTQDQTDANITPDNPSARIVVHNDYDNDGINDITDLDDDNDGIYDDEECSNLSFNISSGNTHSSALISVENYLILDIFSLDNSFNLQINGTDLAGEIQFQNSPGNFARFSDGFGYGEDGNPQIYTLTGSHGSPLLRVVVDQLGQFSLFGSRTSNGPLEPMELTTPANAFTWNASGTNNVTISQNIVGPTNMQGVLLTAGCDTDSDNIPDQLDLDSDGDGCSDANEFYKDENADGGDGGEYGTGIPAVDPNDGTVNAASYVRVLAPEILLGNTTEDLGGTDVNGQELNLGQSYKYVLSFQNTGDDHATNFTIHDLFPNNITIDNIIVPDPSITFSTDLIAGTIDFAIPDSFVEIGDPEYEIEIEFTIDSNCSSFVDACSSQLENRAYVTYQGVANTSTFTDENGSNSINGCPRTPEVASNSVFDALAGCNTARTAQLCGDDETLSAGQGFTTYNWYLDTNGNGQIDATDTEMNDGDPDSNPSTLLITDIGTYMVEKVSNGSCPDLVEVIDVERFGTTQTNPIITYFNQVNNDIDPDNDLQGEIVTCTIDGDDLPKIFLCGVNDEAAIQLGITDAQSIQWQKLNEGSCTVAPGTPDTPENCANKNGTCTWSDVATSSDYTITDAGEYRIVLNYAGGCFSRFYFKVFRNDLDIIHTSEDILCANPGNIRITNIGTGYGFQLMNSNDDSIIVPFSANNGPNFNITSSGTYYVQITQLYPMDGSPNQGTPIAGTCIFETEDIGIQEQIFDVVIPPTTPADCNNLGSITVQALNARPNYSYELFLDDGSNGGQGSLVASELAVNDNTHTFLNVAPGDYIVITSTQDGCSITTRDITVTEIPELRLDAVTSENITCTPGVVNLTPTGGLPSPEYEMAIWSIDGILQYTADETSVPDSAFQTETTFLFGDAGNVNREGDYVFIVRDQNGCYDLSNSVRVDDLGRLSISASNSDIVCADSATAVMTVTVSGGTAPYQYSLDGGTTYQSPNTFTNLAAGLYTITVMDSSGTTGTGCIETLDYEITQPFRLLASTAIIEDASCNPAGALVKIMNPSGGQAPYEYSFNGGAFSSVNTSNLLPGVHQFSIQDALGCTYDMELTVPSEPIDPSFSNDVTYDCDGLGTITINPSNTTDFEYSYSLNGSLNTPSNNNVFAGVANGTHAIDIGYSSTLAQIQNTLFFENFGAGSTTQIAEIGPDYCYEPQDGTTVSCNRGPAGILVNGEYTVTNFVTNPIPSLTSPQDHTGLTNGRFLAVDISTFSDTGNEVLNSVLWTKQNIEVLANREITISFWAYNLMNTTGAGNNPEVLVEIFDGAGSLIHSEATSEIPKNNNNADWHERSITFDPGANTDIDIVFRSNVNSNDGNDLILDDIQASQTSEICDKTADITVIVEDNQEFSAALLGTVDPSCNGTSDGSIRFEVANFDAATGFEYSTDGGTNWTTSLVSPVTTPASLSDGTYTVQVRRSNDSSCTTDFIATLTQPDAIVPSLIQTAEFTCFNTGATLEASATGGTPSYEYQLEDTSNAIIVAYQTSVTFSNVTNGDYVIRVRDLNGCEALSTTPVTVSAPETINFDLTGTACYDGSNNASIAVSVTAGNGDYNFRIDGNAWQAPTPSTGTTYTFTGLSNGSYDVEVTDAFGCVSPVQTIVIEPVLTAQVIVTDVSSCADGSITVNATGGDNNFAYAFLPNGNTVQDSDFSSTNVLTVTSGTIGDYDVYVRDNNGTSPYCQFLETVTVANTPALAYTAVPTDAICFGDFGSIEVNITSGVAPYTYELVDVDHGTADQTQSAVVGTSKTYFNLTPGTYTVIITDDTGCSNTVSGIVVAQPDELTADITGITPASCTGDVNDFGFAFSNYPTTLGTIEFSADGGATWISDNSNPGVSDQLTGYLSGDTVNPSMRTIDGSGNTVCQTDLPPFIIPYPLDDLDISISAIIVDCTELQVTVQGSEGVAPYEYAFSDNPGNFNPATATWILGGSTNNLGNPVPAGEGMHQWLGLVPGKTYVFYVRDSNGCVRQSTVNVNDITTNPMEITASFEPSCNGANDGEITYTIVDADGTTEPSMNWTLFDIDDNVIVSSPGNIPYSNTISINGLSADEYYIVVTQVDAGGTSQCNSGSENLLLEELDAITANLNVIQDISCEAPGIIAIDNIQGGGGTFTYTVTGPAPFTTITGTTDNPVEIAANSPGGNYNVAIADQFGCSVNLGNVNLSLAVNPVISGVDVDNCSASNTVTISATSSAPSTVLYSIDGGSTYFDNGGVFTSVSIGNYTAMVKDETGCTASQTFDVHPSLQASVTLDQSLGCGVGNEAEILIEVSAGSSSYDYEIVNTSGTVVARQVLASSPLTTTVTVADTYTVHIYDTTSSPECTRTFTVEVPAAIVPDFTATPTNISCFGVVDGSITLTQVNNGNNPLTYTLNPNNGTFNATTATYENLPGGNYEVVATGPNGCTTTISNIPVNEPNDITFAIPTVTPFGCTSGNTTNNANVSINTSSILGGSGVFVRYEFIEVGSGSVLQNGTDSNYTYTDLAGGDVRVVVYDDNGCNGEVTVTIPAFDALNAPTITIDNAISCSTLTENISIDVTSTITNNTANPTNYEFRQLPAVVYQASNQFTNLAPGDYTFVVRNISTGCEITVDHTVMDPNTFNVSVEKLSDVVCFGDDGSIRLLMSDATYASSFTWDIYDTNGTPSDRSDDGAAVLSGSSPDFGPTPAINIPAGNYLVEVVQDAFPNCAQVRSFTITTPSADLTLDTIDVQHASCDDNQGTALIKPQGGEGPYDITITNTRTSTTLPIVSQVNSYLFQGLAWGIYSVEVVDALGCSETFANAFEILLPQPITGNLTAGNLRCEGDTDADVEFILDGGRNVSPTYWYTLKKYDDASKTTLLSFTTKQNSPIFENQGAGFYTVFVEDDMGCTFENAVAIEIVNPTEVRGELQLIQTLGCHRDAELELTVTGGSGSYEWSVDGINFNPVTGNSHLFPNVTDGTYQYFVRDDLNCDARFPTNEITVQALEDLTLEVDITAAVINCNGESTALIEAKADGGLGNYQYGLFSDVSLTNQIRAYQGTGTFADLPAGNYFVNVQSDDCEHLSEEIRIVDPDLLVAIPVVTNITCNGRGDGMVTFDVTGGSGDYQFAISPNLNQFDDETTFENLEVGDYTAIVQDSKGCFDLVEFSITEPEILEMTLSSTPEICAGDSDGTITIDITGGTAPYSTALNSENDADFVEGRSIIEDLEAGVYFVYIRDANGCSLNTAVTIESGANLNATAEVVYECSGDTPTSRLEVVLEDQAISNDVLYALDSTNPADLDFGSSFENLTAGSHYVTIVHANGCMNTVDFEVVEYEPLQLSLQQLALNQITSEAVGGREGYTFYLNDEQSNDDGTFYIKRTDTYSVRVVDENGCESIGSIYIEFIDIEIPNFFTPDGDGKNDTWIPRNIEQFPDIFIKIYDRYGREIYRIKDNQDAWDGLYQDSDLPTGDYWYIIQLNGEADEREFFGNFTLYR